MSKNARRYSRYGARPRKPVSITCPACSRRFGVISGNRRRMHLHGATFNCRHCGTLLIYRRDENPHVVRFHAWLHTVDSRWPADGVGAEELPL